MLLHLLGPTGAYLSAVLGGLKGFSALHGAAEREEIALGDALRQVGQHDRDVPARGHAGAARAVLRAPQDTRTLRKGVRRLLEHDWEHFAELARRPAGPPDG